MKMDKILKIYIFIFVVIAVGKVILLLHGLIFIGWIRRNYVFLIMIIRVMKETI